ncbi:MAG: GNAT family protein [Halolamina sp.]|uniref:GNAT family N-acetyltransferase n=1 Tax=Halolamina sp. TaxID=1940283 RepID=UPI002FC370C4
MPFAVQDADGYALEASAHLLDHGFRELRLHRISVTVMAGNDASTRLCERLGFVHEGTTREAQFADGEFADVQRYGLLEDEWAGPTAVLEWPVRTHQSHPYPVGLITVSTQAPPL